METRNHHQSALKFVTACKCEKICPLHSRYIKKENYGFLKASAFSFSTYILLSV